MEISSTRAATVNSLFSTDDMAFQQEEEEQEVGVFLAATNTQRRLLFHSGSGWTTRSGMERMKHALHKTDKLEFYKCMYKCKSRP